MTYKTRISAALIATCLVGVAMADGHRPSELAGLAPPAAPADNPQAAEKIALGELLFFDPILSGNGWMSCAFCHRPEAG